MAVKSVLILTASFGEGHNAAARNLRDGILAGYPDCKVAVHDIFKEAYGPGNEFVRRMYLACINRMPAIWALCFQVLDKTPIVNWHIGIYQAAMRRLEGLLSSLCPEVVVTTYPGCFQVLDCIARKRLKRSFQTVTIVTDSITVCSVWHSAPSDFFIVPNEATAETMRERNIPPEKILPLGFPVPAAFETFPIKSCPREGQSWKVLYMVNSGEHLASKILDALLKVHPLEITVTTGRNEALGQALAAQARSAGSEIAVLGWIPDMPALIAGNHILIGKAGGATVQECLAAGTPMIITQIVPGQEEGNARLLMENGAGRFASSPEVIASALQDMIADGGRPWEDLANAARNLGKPDASRRIADFIATLKS
jgi:processive 1,2-diacylglycerol beta-glucosyltransferase